MDTFDIALDKAADRVARQDARTALLEGHGATSGGLALAEACLPRLTQEVSTRLHAPVSGASYARRLLAVLRDLEPERIALCILQSATHAIACGKDMRMTLLFTGINLAGECFAAKLTADNPKLAKTIAKRVKKLGRNVTQKRDIAMAMARADGFRLKHWSRPMYVIAGNWGIDALLSALPDCFVLEDASDNGSVLTVTEEALEVVHEAQAEAVLHNPVFLPMRDAPRPWTGLSIGPLDGRSASAANFVRSRHRDVKAAVASAIKSGSCAPAVAAVNAQQSVAWVINKRILSVIEVCIERGVVVDGIPGKTLKTPKPPKAVDKLTKREFSLWKLAKSEVTKHNRTVRGQRLSLNEDLETARLLAEYAQFYTPMNLDWRGRTYALCHFNFQREDHVRALFSFKHGAPIGEDGLWWLKVHVANCGDFDKISKRSLEERIAWADGNLDMIREVAEAPLEDQRWTQADSPFLFLAACVELSNAISVGPAYITTLPCAWDGSCSGLQHLSAMTRAPEGALVNLTPSLQPQDVYQTVADVVRRRLEAEDHPVAKLALEFGVDRKLVKRNVMTFAYSSKRFGMAAQQQTDTMEPLKTKVLTGELEEHPFESYGKGSLDIPGQAARYLAGHVWQALQEVVDLPAQAMAFLQTLAKVMAHEGKPLRWTTPSGLPWINRYHVPATDRIKLWLHSKGVRVRHSVTVATGDRREIDKDKAANGVSPNFVHALDAAHLALTVNAAVADGIEQIATVHDSFGCLAPEAARFNRIIREEFVRMYQTHDVLSEVLEQAKCDLTQHNWHRLPKLPDYGTLNINEVINARYAFA